MDFDKLWEFGQENKLIILLGVLGLIIYFPVFKEMYWLGAIILMSIGYGAYYKHFERQEFLDRKDCRNLLLFLMVLGLLIRLYELGELSFWHDEAVTANSVKTLLETGAPGHPSGKPYIRELPNQALLAIFSKIFGHTDWALRLPSAILGTLTIGLTYLTGRDFFDKEVGLISAAFITFSSWHITWSNQVRMYAMLQFLFLSSIFLIYLNFQKGLNTKRIILLLSSLVLAILTHLTGYILPFILLGFILLVIKDKENSLKKIAALIIPVGIAFAAINVMYRNMFTLVFSWMEFTTSNVDLYLEWLVSDLHVMLGLGIAGSLISVKENFKASYLAIASSLPIFITYIILWEQPGGRYLFVTLPFLAILSALFLSKTSYRISELGFNRRSVLTILVFMTIIFGNFASGDYEPGLRAPQTDFRSAYNYVEDNMREDDVVISAWTPPTTHYLRSPDYALMPKTLVKDTDDEGVEYYSGSPIIRNSGQLRNIIRESERGWIVLDDRAFESQSNSRQEIIRDLDKVHRSREFQEITVWRWTRRTDKLE